MTWNEYVMNSTLNENKFTFWGEILYTKAYNLIAFKQCVF